MRLVSDLMDNVVTSTGCSAVIDALSVIIISFPTERAYFPSVLSVNDPSVSAYERAANDVVVARHEAIIFTNLLQSISRRLGTTSPLGDNCEAATTATTVPGINSRCQDSGATHAMTRANIPTDRTKRYYIR